MPRDNSGRGNPAFFVPTAMLADILAPLIHEQGEDVVLENEKTGEVTVERIGGITAISNAMTMHLPGMEAESGPRRLWSIMNHETMRTGTMVADSILLACERMIEDYDLPVFPSQYPAAADMVEIYNENHPEDPAPEGKDFQRTLINFAKGFVSGLHVDAHDLVELEAAKAFCAFVHGTTDKPKKVAVAA